MADGEELPSAGETWTRRPFTRKEFNDLFRITPDMPHEEIARRIRAVSYGAISRTSRSRAIASSTSRPEA